MPLLNEPEDDLSEKCHLSARPVQNADIYVTHQELEESYRHLQAQYDELFLQHAPFTYLGGTLRQLPRMFWQAIRRRFPGAKT